MTLYLSDISALECWRASRRRPPNGDPAVERLYQEHVPSIDAKKLRGLETLGVRTRPVHLVVPSPSLRLRSGKAMTRVWRDPLSPGSFVRIRNGLFACSPELVFLQLAGDLDIIETIRLGYELCGLYSLRADSPQGFENREVPLTTPGALNRFVDSSVGGRGRRAAQQALRHVLERSRSPMETAEAMLLSLPPRLGGKGCPTPELNHRIRLTGLARQVAGRDYVECDVYWKEGIAVEYDSNEFHSTSERRTLDATKRTALEHLGISVFTMTFDQIGSVNGFDAITQAIARAGGWRLPRPRSDFRSREAHLRSAILPHAGVRW